VKLGTRDIIFKLLFKTFECLTPTSSIIILFYIET
jgi:hypothetical protein